MVDRRFNDGDAVEIVYHNPPKSGTVIGAEQVGGEWNYRVQTADGAPLYASCWVRASRQKEQDNA